MPDRTLAYRLSRTLCLSGLLALVAAFVAYRTGENVCDAESCAFNTAGAVWTLAVLGVALVLNGSVLYNWSVEASDAAKRTPTD